MEQRQSEQPARGLKLDDYLRLIRSHWAGMLICLVACTAIALGAAMVQTPIYAADSRGVIAANTEGNVGSALSADSLTKSKAKTYHAVATSRQVARRVIKKLNLDTTSDRLISDISVDNPEDTSILHITAKSTDPARAQKLADAWVTALAAEAKKIETGKSDSKHRQAVSVKPLASASLPTSPVSPNIKLIGGIGFAAGLVAALIYALVRNHLDRKIRSAKVIEENFGVAVIGTIPADKRLASGRRVLEDRELSAVSGDRSAYAYAEALRELRTNLTFVNVDDPPRVIMVSSPTTGEGKSSIVSNLAATIAASGEDVVVVDADLRRPVITKMFDLVRGVGVTDVLSGQAELDDVLQPSHQSDRLSVLGAGRIPPNPSEILGSVAMNDLLKALSARAIVLVDVPPLLPVTDAAVLSRSTDGVLITASAGKTTMDEFGKALANLHHVNAHVFGTILNKVPTRGLGASQYGYYGGYYYRGSGDSDDANGGPSVVTEDKLSTPRHG